MFEITAENLARASASVVLALGVASCASPETTTPDLPLSAVGEPAFNTKAAEYNSQFPRIACTNVTVGRSGNTLKIDTVLEPEIRGGWLSFVIDSTEPRVTGSVHGQDPIISLAGVGRHGRITPTVQIPHRDGKTIIATCNTVSVPK